MLDLNKGEEFGAKEVKIFNNGEAGIIGGVEIRVEKKQDDSNQPNYKLFAKDANGEINEGFYYAEDRNGKTAIENFKVYQAQKLINLAKGVMGEGFTFPQYSSPKEALDGIMLLIKKNSEGKKFRVAVTYGTTGRPSKYMQFKSFGRFIEQNDVPSTLKLDANDSIKPIVPDGNQVEDPFGNMEGGKTSGGSESSDDLPW